MSMLTKTTDATIIYTITHLAWLLGKYIITNYAPTLKKALQTEWGRFKVIVQHEIDKARGFQHESKVEHCTFGNCSTL